MNGTRRKTHGLTARQLQAVAALLESPSIESAAERAGVNRSTLHGWLNRDEFRRAFDDAKRVAFDAALGRISSAGGMAANRVIELLDSPNESVVLGACRLLLEIGINQVDAAIIRRQLAEIERRMEARP